MKFVESEDKQYGKEQLLPLETLHELGKSFCNELRSGIYSKLLCVDLQYLLFLPTGSIVKCVRNNKILFLPAGTKLMNYGIEELNVIAFKKSVKEIIKSNCK